MNKSIHFNHSIHIAKKILNMAINNPATLLPFAVVALIDFLCVFFLLPGRFNPFSGLLTAFIKSVWGETFIEYPVIVLILPMLFSYAKIITNAVMGLFLAGVATSMMYRAAQNTRVIWRAAVRKAARKYVQLLASGGGAFLGMLLLFGSIDSLLPFSAVEWVRVLPGFLGMLVVQAVFVFTLPAIIIENKKFQPAVKRSLEVLNSNSTAAFIFVVIPNLFLLPVMYAYLNMPGIAAKWFPGSIFLLLGTRIILVTLINYGIIASTVVLFQSQKYKERNAQNMLSQAALKAERNGIEAHDAGVKIEGTKTTDDFGFSQERAFFRRSGPNEPITDNTGRPGTTGMLYF